MIDRGAIDTARRMLQVTKKVFKRAVGRRLITLLVSAVPQALCSMRSIDAGAGCERG